MTEVIRDEEVRRRIRLAQEFLDPGTHHEHIQATQMLTGAQMMFRSEGMWCMEDRKQTNTKFRSYRPDILVMLNRGQRRLTVRQISFLYTSAC
jgi:DNA replication licensing factor MCM3